MSLARPLSHGGASHRWPRRKDSNGRRNRSGLRVRLGVSAAAVSASSTDAPLRLSHAYTGHWSPHTPTIDASSEPPGDRGEWIVVPANDTGDDASDPQLEQRDLSQHSPDRAVSSHVRSHRSYDRPYPSPIDFDLCSIDRLSGLAPAILGPYTMRSSNVPRLARRLPLLDRARPLRDCRTPSNARPLTTTDGASTRRG
jgi:hypothetical protein